MALPRNMSFYEFLALAEDINTEIDRSQLRGRVQLATFHPRFRFEDSEQKDPADYTNRSPFPLLHFLREDDVSEAIDAYTAANGVGPDKVWQRNSDLCREIGNTKMKAHLDSTFVEIILPPSEEGKVQQRQNSNHTPS